MPTDDERREVARRLREDAKRYLLEGRFCSNEMPHRLAKAIECRYMGAGPQISELFPRLADLIEPSCDRDTPQKAAEEMFGKMRHSTKEEADAYDAMLKSKSVEIHPVDRDALLRLARYMDKDVAETEAHFSNVISTKSVSDYARRIREACGEVGR